MILPFYCFSLLIGLFIPSILTGPVTGKTVVSISGRQWLINGQVTYPGTPAEGLLMNVRMVQATFEDDRPKGEWEDLLPEGFNSNRNTRTFIKKIPGYMQSGIRGFTISLQGGFPGYEGAVNSAFNADGSLRPAYMKRAKKVIKACDRLGAVVILTCLYQRQHSHSRALDGKPAIIRAVQNVAEWIKKNEFTNVVLEIANEYPHGGFRNWKDGEWLKSAAGQVELIRAARAVNPELYVSTSGLGNLSIDPAVAQEADFILLHGNSTDLDDYQDRIGRYLGYGKPVLLNEDDKTGSEGAQAAQRAVKAGAGWGFMHNTQNQYVPFRWEGVADDPEVYKMIRSLTQAQ